MGIEEKHLKAVVSEIQHLESSQITDSVRHLYARTKRYQEVAKLTVKGWLYLDQSVVVQIQRRELLTHASSVRVHSKNSQF